MTATTRQPTRSRVVPVIPQSAEPVTTCLDPATPALSLSSPSASVPVTTPMFRYSPARNNQPLVPGQGSSSTEVMPNNDAPTIPMNTTTTLVDAPPAFSSSDAGLDQPSSDQHISADPAHEDTTATGTSQHFESNRGLLHVLSFKQIQEKEAAKISEYNQGDSCIKVAAD
ncbi:hypothetical protein V6N11_012908 [Hibiscus sabdariffa]|uniref:Uncharacterized protein n=1 Tax=Hibiscus sabdariffa TaxID=183260 RepID=A0ABR2N970_9ROSI